MNYAFSLLGDSYKMILISGIHGVGKTFLCNKIERQLGIKSFTASELIKKYSPNIILHSKTMSDAAIEQNQSILVYAVNTIKNKYDDFILDGHLCLINNSGIIIRISQKTFVDLNPNMLIILTEDAHVISRQRYERDKIKQPISLINSFQHEEISYGKEIANLLNIPIYISTGSNDIRNIIEIITNSIT